MSVAPNEVGPASQGPAGLQFPLVGWPAVEVLAPAFLNFQALLGSQAQEEDPRRVQEQVGGDQELKAEGCPLTLGTRRLLAFAQLCLLPRVPFPFSSV